MKEDGMGDKDGTSGKDGHGISMTAKDMGDVKRWIGALGRKLEIPPGEVIYRAVEMMAAWHEIEGRKLTDIDEGGRA